MNTHIVLLGAPHMFGECHTVTTKTLEKHRRNFSSRRRWQMNILFVRGKSAWLGSAQIPCFVYNVNVRLLYIHSSRHIAFVLFFTNFYGFLPSRIDFVSRYTFAISYSSRLLSQISVTSLPICSCPSERVLTIFVCEKCTNYCHLIKPRQIALWPLAFHKFFFIFCPFYQSTELFCHLYFLSQFDREMRK